MNQDIEVTKTGLENQKTDEFASDLQTFIRTGLLQRTGQPV